MLTKDYDITKRKHRYVRISSEDKASGTNSQFTVNLPASGQVIDTVVGYMVKYASVPNQFPNIPTYAQDLTLFASGAPATPIPVQVPAGQYTQADFIIALQAAINGAIGPDTVVVSSVFGANGDTLNFVFAGANTYAFDLAGSSIFEKIGLSADIATAANITMQNPINLIGESEVWIHSRILNQSGLIEAQGNFSTVDVIPVDVAFGVVAHMTYPDQELALINFEPYENKKTLRTVDIVLRNRAGNVLLLPSNFKFTLLLKVFHEL